MQSGVPQDSHLGPILFTLFRNDLSSVVLHFRLLMYADDIKIFNIFNNVYRFDLLRADFCSFYKWCKLNLLELNIKTCKVKTFFRHSKIDTFYYIGNAVLDKVKTILDLGILLDHGLNFQNNISMTVNKAFFFVDPYLTKMLFVSLVRPILQ